MNSVVGNKLKQIAVDRRRLRGSASRPKPGESRKKKHDGWLKSTAAPAMHSEKPIQAPVPEAVPDKAREQPTREETRVYPQAIPTPVLMVRAEEDQVPRAAVFHIASQAVRPHPLPNPIIRAGKKESLL